MALSDFKLNISRIGNIRGYFVMSLCLLGFFLWFGVYLSPVIGAQTAEELRQLVAPAVKAGPLGM
ncbi:MAG: hypothetical protein N3E40_06785, partial [Dehalococcoidia bacterium]|nr:hypothetical protein [Dehalococcoidia bacterium]